MSTTHCYFQSALPRALHTARVLLTLTVGLPFVISTSSAQNVSGISDREIVRRQESVVQADALVSRSDQAMARGDYETAYVSLLDALELIPEGPAASKVRAPVIAKFSKASLGYANKLIEDGRYADAERVAKTILLPQFDPENRDAVRLLSRLEQPDTFNKTVTPGFAADRELVTKLLGEAKAFYAAGRLDLASRRYEQALLLDPYNSAARMGMEEIVKQQTTYYSSAYNETRSRMLWLADRAWERPLNRNLTPRSTDVGSGSRTDVRGTEAITAKLNRIIIPKIELNDTSVRDAVDFLKQRSRDLDRPDDGSPGQGVNIVLKLAQSPVPGATPADPLATPPAEGTPAEGGGGTADTRITMSLSNVPLIEALRYLTDLAQLKYKIEPFAVSIVPVSENTTDLVTKEYKVPPGFIPASTGADAGGFTSPAAGPSDSLGAPRITGRADAKSYLESQQIPFPEGAFAQYVPAGSKLIVRNTPDALDLIDYLVDAASGFQPKQVEIESKFIEISQNNLEELGFDWLLGPLSIGNGVYGAGGTEGFGQAIAPSTFPFGNVGTNPVTGGMRSGAGTGPNAAVTANSIDALIAGIPQGAFAAAPGIFGIAGIFSNPQFQVVIRALSQQKGVDLMSAPKVTTVSGKKAIVKVVREFPYPTEFNPPEVPTSEAGATEGGTSSTIQAVVTTSSAVTPSTPTTFETRDVGVTLEVLPVIGPDNYTIDLDLVPQVVEFDGFVNYGSPVIGPTFDPALIAVNGTGIGVFDITPNVINQPIFSTRKVTTSVSVWDGQTIALGGLIREDIQKTNDKVPILGDIPLAGRLFRSNVDQKIKRNLIIFVTARIMDAEGRPLRQDDTDQEEIVEPLGLPADLPRPSYQEASKGGYGK